MEKPSYEKGTIPIMIEKIIGWIDGGEPTQMTRTALWNYLKKEFPELKDPTRCPNCLGSMKAYWYEVNYQGTMTLMKMNDVIRKRMSEGMNFTDANKLHVVKMQELNDAERHQTTILRFLGLLAKVKNKDGKQKNGLWCITSRGFDYLHGEAIPSRVKAFRNKIDQRADSTETITIQQVLSTLKTDMKEHYKSEGVQGRML